MSVITDLDRGVVERLLAAPAHRIAIFRRARDAGAARFNPVDSGVVAAREPALAGTNSVVACGPALLAAFGAAGAAFATWAFRAYQPQL